MKKRMMWGLLASAIVVSVLVAGCASSSPTASNPPATQSQSSVGTTAPAQSQTSGSQTLAALFSKYKQGRDESFDFNVTMSSGKTASGTMWKQGNMLKIQATAEGKQLVIINNYADNTMIMYQPATDRGMKRTGVNSSYRNPGSYLDGVDPGSVQDLGTAVLNGENCRVFQYALTAEPTTTVKMWLDVDQAFPVQIVSTDAAGAVTTLDFTNLKVGPLPSDTFTVPSSVNITDMTS